MQPPAPAPPHAVVSPTGSPDVVIAQVDPGPLTQLPPLQTAIPVRKPTISSYSPSTKRKPLPVTAFSPVSTAPVLLLLKQDVPYQPPLNRVIQSQPLEPTPISGHSHSFSDTIVHSSAHLQRDSYQLDHTSVPRSKRVSLGDFPIPPRRSDVRRRPSSHRFTDVHEEEEGPITEEEMGMLRSGDKPPPLRTDSLGSIKPADKKTHSASPGNKFTSFFMRKQTASPGADSAMTDASESKSPMPSPYMHSEHSSTGSAVASYFNIPKHTSAHPSQDSLPFVRRSDDMFARCNVLEAELREISIELAGSIRRELDLEDMVEKLQANNQHPTLQADRTSDYFSDYGTVSSRMHGSDVDVKEEIEKIRRDADQKRAAQRVELSQKWQEEITQRKNLELRVQQAEEQLHTTRRGTGESTDVRVKELEGVVDDHRRRLYEERKSKENFEEICNALREELAKHRSEKDNLRDEVVPGLRARVEGLEASLAETQKQPYDVSKLQQEVQSLRDENAALLSAREMERGISRNSMHFISEEDDLSLPGVPKVGLSRSNTINAGRGNRGSLMRSGSLNRGNSTLSRSPTIPSSGTLDNPADLVKAIEQQRDALHNTVKYLLKRQEVEKVKAARRTRMLETEVERSTSTTTTKRRGGYEREVRVLRAEINTLRRRADDALDQKWQCEKGLAGLKMDLDRNKQETASLQRLLQAKGSDPDVHGFMSTSLETAIMELQKERVQTQESAARIEQEQGLADQVEESAARSEQLAAQVKKQLQSNAALRTRLKNAVEVGERNQKASAEQVAMLQVKLKKLEDQITTAQMQSETAVMKHEEEVNVLRASHNASLMRTISSANPNKRRSNLALLTPTARSPLSPMFANSKRSPRLDKTTSGPGMPLHEALRTEYLENKVTALEKALTDADNEMGEVVARMNTAQIGVAELEAERDEALKQTRALEDQVQQEREKYAHLIRTLNEW